MIKHGEAPFLECSSRGDKRFSAFYALVNSTSIEDSYQAAKIFNGRNEGETITGLNWRQAKGNKAINMEECAKLYSQLWDHYILHHPYLLDILKQASGLSDIFGQPGHCCQATELWRIRNQS